MNLEINTSNLSASLELERLSALIDGELDDAGLEQLMAAMADKEQGASVYSSWQAYLAIGDVVRSSQVEHAGSPEFLGRLNAALAREAPLIAIEQPVAGEVRVPSMRQADMVVPAQEAANQSVYRWKLVAGLASVAAVAMVGWSSMSLMSSGQPASGQQVAAGNGGITQVASAPVQGLVQMPVTVGQNATVMLRDPRLDELLAARGQIGGTTNLQMPASFLRNATFNAEKQGTGCTDKASRLC